MKRKDREEQHEQQKAHQAEPTLQRPKGHEIFIFCMLSVLAAITIAIGGQWLLTVIYVIIVSRLKPCLPICGLCIENHQYFSKFSHTCMLIGNKQMPGKVSCLRPVDGGAHFKLID